jgi:hypothetical protein
LLELGKAKLGTHLLFLQLKMQQNGQVSQELLYELQLGVVFDCFHQYIQVQNALEVDSQVELLKV